jgi:glucosamine kinase
MAAMLIIDSGATKADWVLLDQHSPKGAFKTPGIHPFFLSDEAIRDELLKVRQQCGNDIREVHFYGTGCKAQSSIDRLQSQFHAVFTKAQTIHIETDVLGAARALCQYQPGIACILGTGSNSVWYDGSAVVGNTGGYGYVLGDEGSGALLGRDLITAWINHEMPTELQDAFPKKFPFSLDEIIEKVYRGDTPSRYLASFVPFLYEHSQHPFIQQLLHHQFALFIRRCVLVYPPAPTLPVHFTGSFAFHFRDTLTEALRQAGLRPGQFLPAPMEGLIAYHQQAASH